MRDRQLCAVTLAAASVPALLYLPRLGWVWATAAAAISALLLGLCGRRCAPGGLTEVIPAAFGRAGRAVLALVLLGGALLLGPVGLAGGFLIRGNDKQLKEGTLFYVQTVDNVTVSGYKIPQQITPITQTEDSAPQGTQSAPLN